MAHSAAHLNADSSKEKGCHSDCIQLCKGNNSYNANVSSVQFSLSPVNTRAVSTVTVCQPIVSPIHFPANVITCINTRYKTTIIVLDYAQLF